MPLAFVIIVGLLVNVNCTFYKENITDLSKCKVHFSKSEGRYADFFQITSSSENLLFDFHFLVSAQSDAHIMLTPSKTVRPYVDPVYEIVLGAGRNRYSSIRRAMRGKERANYVYQNILSVFEPRGFWIHVSKDGLIEVGRETHYVPFLMWRDPDPVPLVYFSLSTWPGVEAKWFYDCERNATKEIEPVLNDIQRLLADYVQNYKTFEIPLLSNNEQIEVNMTMKSLFLNLNEMEGKLQSIFSMTQTWVDQKLTWLPSEYGGIESLQLQSYQIWTPTMRYFSNVDEFQKTTLDTKLYVTYDGKVTQKSNLQLKTWCNAANLNEWPEDGHVCKIPVGFYIDSDKIIANLTSNLSDLVDIKYQTVWKVENIEYNVFSPQSIEEPSWEIVFHLKRISIAYKLIYVAPLIVIAVGTLLTFWVSPFGYLKLGWASLNVCLVTAVLIQMALYIPGHPEKVPKIRKE